MTSSRTLLYNLCIILLFGLILVHAENTSQSTQKADDVPKGNCSCGGFSKNVINTTDEPMLSQSPGLVVNCDTEGSNTCKSLCNAMAMATKAKGPEVLCNRLKNTEELKLSAFYKICDLPWTYADLTADTPLCCEDKQVKSCGFAEKNNATDTITAKFTV